VLRNRLWQAAASERREPGLRNLARNEGGSKLGASASIGVFLVTAALCLGLVTGCPLGPFSGSRLSGDVNGETVGDWSFVDDVLLCQIETNPADPHSVNTWCTGIGAHLYVPTSMIYGPTSPSDREWVRNVLADPRVRLRVGGVVYERTATRVDDDAQYAVVRADLERKYELEAGDLDPEREIWIYRMDRRAGRP